MLVEEFCLPEELLRQRVWVEKADHAIRARRGRAARQSRVPTYAPSHFPPPLFSRPFPRVECAGGSAQRALHSLRRYPLERDELRRASDAQDAQHRPHRQRRRAVCEHVLHHFALLAQPRVDPHRAVRAHATACATTSPNSRRRCRTCRCGCARPATRPPTSASGTWARTTTRRAPASTSSPPTRDRASTSTPSATSTAQARRSSRATTRPSSPIWRWTGSRSDHGGKPWALCIGHKAPHSFYMPEDEVRAHVRRRPRALSRHGVPPRRQAGWIRQRLYTWHGIYGPLFDWRKKFPDDRPEAVKDFENMVHAYWGTILSVDDSVGRLLAFLEETKQLDNTIIVFMGDNGLLEGEHGMVDKRTMHEPSLRIPLLVRYPALAQRQGHRAAGAHPRHGAEHAGTLRREAAGRSIHGKSWVKLVREGDAAWRQVVVLRIQLREAISLHAERPRRAHRRVEVHPLSAWCMVRP